MAYTTINKSTAHFNTITWTGNASARSLTGVGHAPDLVWVKDRSETNGHALFDKVRGVNKYITTNQNIAELNQPSSGYVSAFDSDGFSGVTGSSSYANWNKSGNNYVAWNWKANGQGSSNTDGSINTTYTSVNTTAGFSISKYTGTGANATVGHGLGAVPKMIIVKNLDQNDDWYVYHVSRGATKHIILNSTGTGGTNSTLWQDTTPTNSVFSIGTNNVVNTSGEKYIAYCFAEKTGYSKFGSYTGNGSASSGTFVYTGFKPAFVMIKRTDTTGSWEMYDAKREGFNPQVHGLTANTSNAEDNTDDLLDLLSNGFKLYHDGGGLNASGGTYIFIAFGQSLVGSNNVPCTAR